jgi:hypothetical protein
MREKNLTRMLWWLALAAFFYVLATVIQQPQLETACWKLGHITSGAFLGYWIDRHLFGRYTSDFAATPRALSRAIVVGCAIIGMAFGL